jgi:phosphoribosylformimino-5-aminoimidazole carboxamide ribotide isomerase
VVDLNGAIEGKAVNEAAVQAIMAAVSIPVQLGGGVRTLGQIETWIEAGISRVILGTIAVRQPELVRKAAAEWPEQIAIAIDVKDGRAAIEGWTEVSDVSAADMARRFEDAGVSALIVTDISRDGALTGVNVEGVGEIADVVSIPVIASGGVASVDDLRRLMARKGARPIEGAVLGRSLYAGTIKPAEALRIAS